MTVSVRKATDDDLYQVYGLLSNSTLNSAWLSLDARKRMFRPVWGGDEGYYGYVLEDDDKVVGFLGLLFTEREIKGETHKFCELHSWYVKDEYRNDSMRLFLPAMSMRNITIVNHTPTDTVYDVSKKFGFSDLESKLLIFLPVPTWKSLSAAVTIETRKHLIAEYLDDADRRIFLDHADVECHHFLVRSRYDSGYSYIVLKKMWLRRFVPFGRILYVSNEQLLLDCISKLKLYWCLRLGLQFIVIDRDQLATPVKPPLTRESPRKVPSQYKSPVLAPEDIRPPLYTLPLLLGYRLH
jgi:hypothetical protein